MVFESDKGQSRWDVSTRLCVMIVLMTMLVGGTVIAGLYVSSGSCGCSPIAAEMEPKKKGWLGR